MTTDATFAAYQEAERALLRLAVPALAPTCTFKLSSSSFLGFGDGSDAIDAWDLTVDDFTTAEDFEKAQGSPVIWLSQIWVDPFNTDTVLQKAASTLASLLGHQGEDRLVQGQACEAFERFFPGMTLALNDYLECGHGAIAEFLYSENAVRSQTHPHYPPLFDSSPEQQADLARAADTGLWTVIDQEASTTLSASSSLSQALARAWAIAPHLEPMRRMRALSEQLPAPSKTQTGPRF